MRRGARWMGVVTTTMVATVWVTEAFSNSGPKMRAVELRDLGRNRHQSVVRPTATKEEADLERSFALIASEFGGAGEVMSKMPPGLGQAVTRTAVPLGALATSVLMPGPLLAAGFGAIAGGGLTRVAFSPMLMEGRCKALQHRVATLLHEASASGHFDEGLGAEIKALSDSWALPREHTRALLTQIYSRFLQDVVDLSDIRTSEIKNLLVLRKVLDLDHAACGDAHYETAVAAYRDMQWTDVEIVENPESSEYKKVSTMLFLLRRTLASMGSTAEISRYELGRVGAVFGLSSDDLRDRCDEVARPLYENALSGAIDTLGMIEPGTLFELGESLGMSSDKIEAINEDYFEAVVAEVLQSPPDDETRNYVDQVAGLLGLTTDTTNRIASAHTYPGFQAALDSTFEALARGDAVEAATVEKAMAEAWMPAKVALDLYSRKFSALMDASLAVIKTSIAQASPVEDTVELINALIAKNQIASDLYEAVSSGASSSSSSEEPSSSDNLERVMATSIQSTFSSGVSVKDVFSAALQNQIATGKSSVDLDKLAKLFGIDESASDLLEKQVIKQEMASLLSQIAQDGTGTEAFSKWLHQPTHSASLVHECKLSKYEDELKSVKGASIPSERDVGRLEKLRQVLELTAVDVEPLHYEAFSTVYEQSALEAFTCCTDVTLWPSYGHSLEVLGARLGLSDADRRSALTKAASQVFSKSLARLKLQNDDDSAEEEDATIGIDVNNPNNADNTGEASAAEYLAEVSKAVALYSDEVLDAISNPVGGSGHLTENLGLTQRTSIYQTACLCLLAHRPDRPLPKDVPIDPLTAVDRLPRLLGLSPAVASQLRKNAGALVAEKIYEGVLRRQGQLDPNLTALMNKLEEEMGVDVRAAVLAAKRKILLARIKVAADHPGDIKQIRDFALSLGTDMVRDLGLSKDMLKSLLKSEIRETVSSLLVSKLTAADAAEALSELAEAYDQDQTEELEKTVQKLCEEQLDFVQAEFKSSRVEPACELLARVLDCLDFVPSLQLKSALWILPADRRALYSTLETYLKSTDGLSDDKLAWLKHLLLDD